jgi:pilus assembly protein CpaF
MESDVITMQDIFTFDFHAGRDEHGRFRGKLISTGLRPKFAEELQDQGVDLPANIFVRGI